MAETLNPYVFGELVELVVHLMLEKRDCLEFYYNLFTLLNVSEIHLYDLNISILKKAQKTLDKSYEEGKTTEKSYIEASFEFEVNILKHYCNIEHLELVYDYMSIHTSIEKNSLELLFESDPDEFTVIESKIHFFEIFKKIIRILNELIVIKYDALITSKQRTRLLELKDKGLITCEEFDSLMPKAEINDESVLEEELFSLYSEMIELYEDLRIETKPFMYSYSKILVAKLKNSRNWLKYID